MSSPSVKSLCDIVGDLPQQKAAVIGDIMLDAFEYGVITRMSPEAPVPVVSMQERQQMPGGAANVSHNIRSLGASADQFGVVGDDAAGARLRTLLEEQGIGVAGIVTDRSRHTTEKKRIVGPEGHLLRVDYELTHDISESIEDQLLEQFQKKLHEYTVVVIADYAKGAVTERLAREILHRCKEAGLPVIVDTKPAHAAYFEAPTLVTPNHHEALEIAETQYLAEAGSRLLAIFQCPVLITCGSEGMTLFTESGSSHIPSSATAVNDVSGAGDTVTAGAALAIAAKGTLEEAAHIASVLAGIVVEKQGTASVSSGELSSALCG